MWLIETDTLKLKEFQGLPDAPYAVLSHRWGPSTEETTFAEFKAGIGHQKLGFTKIRACCKQAWKNGLEYAWVDTCCIDKSSSTELSEAINSMFNWYMNADVCYVYLNDVTDPAELAQSLWFTRGWTLQELIAPADVLLFDRNWKWLGDKSTLSQELQQKTGIPVSVLSGTESFRRYSVAQRMSWASKRQTSRIEDSAYCLMGLFDVSMPLLYGEGPRAFVRLQRAIIEQTDDETIFAWTGVARKGSGLLAPNVASFANSGHVVPPEPSLFRQRPPYSNTNRGWHLECQMIRLATNVFLVPLNCAILTPDSKHQRIGIYLCGTTNRDQYRRVSLYGASISIVTDLMVWKGKISHIFVPEAPQSSTLLPHQGLPCMSIESNLPFVQLPHKNEVGLGYKWIEATKSTSVLGDFSSPEYRVAGISHSTSTKQPRDVQIIQFQPQHLQDGVVIEFEKRSSFGLRCYYYLQVGFDSSFDPVCIIRRSRLKWSYYTSPAGLSFSLAIIFSERFIALRRFLWRREYCLPALSKSDLLPRREIRLPFFDEPVEDPIEGNRTIGVRTSRWPDLPLDYGCIKLDINFRPQENTLWLLSFKEGSAHPGYHCYGFFCTNRCFRLIAWLYKWSTVTVVPIGSVWFVSLMFEKFKSSLTKHASPTPEKAFQNAMYLSLVVLISDRVSSLLLPGHASNAWIRSGMSVLIAVIFFFSGLITAV